MNEALMPPVPPATSAGGVPGVYVELAQLVRLQYHAAGFSFRPRQPPGSILAGRWASRLRGRGLNFEEIRQYLPGDDIRQMDWKVTARSRAPHVRVYTEEHGRPVLLLVDQRLSMFFGSRQNFKSVTAVEVAALAAWRVISMRDNVGAIVFSDETMEVLPAAGDRNHVMQLLGALVKRNRALSLDAGIVPAPAMLNAALARAARLAPHDALVLVITDGSGHDGETRRHLSRIACHNDVLVALISDPLEAELPDAGPLTFGAGDLQLEADTGRKSLRDAFRSTFQQRTEAARHFLIQREVPLMPIRTDQDPAAQFRHLLGRRPQK